MKGAKGGGGRKERDFRGLVAVPSHRRLEEEGSRLKGRVTKSISEKASGGPLCCARAPGTFVFSTLPAVGGVLVPSSVNRRARSRRMGSPAVSGQRS